ncbi:MAG: FkbM family methyltransferase, partial [Acidimicrobiales bacterium]
HELMPRVRLVKLDLEGAEVDALRGATCLLENSSADFLVEVEGTHLARQGTSEHELYQIFEGFDRRQFPGSPNCLFTRPRPAP